jgi:hypothetical protein
MARVDGAKVSAANPVCDNLYNCTEQGIPKLLFFGVMCVEKFLHRGIKIAFGGQLSQLQLVLILAETEKTSTFLIVERPSCAVCPAAFADVVQALPKPASVRISAKGAVGN